MVFLAWPEVSLWFPDGQEVIITEQRAEPGISVWYPISAGTWSLSPVSHGPLERREGRAPSSLTTTRNSRPRRMSDVECLIGNKIWTNTADLQTMPGCRADITLHCCPTTINREERRGETEMVVEMRCEMWENGGKEIFLSIFWLTWQGFSPVMWSSWKEKIRMSDSGSLCSNCRWEDQSCLSDMKILLSAQSVQSQCSTGHHIFYYTRNMCASVWVIF